MLPQHSRCCTLMVAAKSSSIWAFEGDGWLSPHDQRSTIAGCSKSLMLDSSYMLVPAGAEPQPQQPATVPAAPPRLLAHSQWAVLPAPRKTSRRAAPQPRPGSAASRIAAGAAGSSGHADAGGGSVGQVGLKEVTCAEACCPCKTTQYICANKLQCGMYLGFISPLLATLPGRWGLQDASQPALPLQCLLRTVPLSHTMTELATCCWSLELAVPPVSSPCASVACRLGYLCNLRQPLHLVVHHQRLAAAGLASSLVEQEAAVALLASMQ